MVSYKFAVIKTCKGKGITKKQVKKSYLLNIARKNIKEQHQQY